MLAALCVGWSRRFGSMFRSLRFGALLGLLLALAGGSVAHAGGFELPGVGAHGMARGGANYAAPNSPMALYYNPANLAATSGLQLSLDVNLNFANACFQRTGTYYESSTGSRIHGPAASTPFEDRLGAGVDARLGSALPEVCNSGPPQPVPELILSWRPHRLFGVAFGVIAPNAVGHTRWGDSETIGDRTYEGIVDGLPSPARYGLIEEQLIMAFPTIGVGLNAHERVRFGVSFGWGVGYFRFKNAVRAIGGEDFGGDVYSDLEALDGFIPRIGASVQVTPIDNFDIMLGFTWTDDVKANADLRTITGYYRDEFLEDLTIPDAGLTAAQPWQLAFSMRYADRRVSRADAEANAGEDAPIGGNAEDPLRNERWDIEFAAVWERNSRVQSFGVDIPDCDPSVGRCEPSRMRDGRFTHWRIEADSNFDAPLPSSIEIPHNWQDTLSLRLGGSYTVIPNVLQLSAGLNYETKGIETGYEQLDFMPFQRFGGGLGGTFRVGNFDLRLAYSFIHQSTVTVTDAQAQARQVNSEERLAQEDCGEPEGRICSTDEVHLATGRPTTVVNAGRYSSNFHMVSLGLTYRFN